MIPIIMPQVGQDIPTAKVVEWLKRENDSVEKGEIVVVVESEKASFEVEAEQSGVILKILHEEGEEVEVFKPLAYLGEAGETFDVSKIEKPAAAAPAGAATARPATEGGARETRAVEEKVAASPAARRIAKERGIDLAAIQGSGPGGRIVKEDVLAGASVAAPAAAAISPEDTCEPFSKLRKELARRLTLSKQTIPHFYLFADVDMTDALEWRRRVNAAGETKISVTDMIVKATAMALKDYGRMNAHVKADGMTIKGGIHIGVAVAVDGGLLVPVIPNADAKSLREIAEQSRKNAEGARRGVMDAGAVGTFTISSLGMYGVPMFLPVINPPESTILAVGAVERRVVPVEEGVGVRDMMTLTLACDHRAVDGAYGGRFLNRIKENLEGWAEHGLNTD